MKDSKEYWESDSAVVHSDESDSAFEKYVDEIMKYLQPKKEELILDLGCGYGQIAGRLQKRCGSKIIGVDLSNRLLGMARKKYPELEWMQGDVLEKWKFADASFHKIFTCELLQYVPPEKIPFVFNEIKRVLKPNGKAIHFYVPDKTKFFTWFNTPYKVLKLGIKSYMTDRIFKDGSYWHKPCLLIKIAKSLALDIEITSTSYRCHVTLTKMPT